MLPEEAHGRNRLRHTTKIRIPKQTLHLENKVETFIIKPKLLGSYSCRQVPISIKITSWRATYMLHSCITPINESKRKLWNSERRQREQVRILPLALVNSQRPRINELDTGKDWNDVGEGLGYTRSVREVHIIIITMNERENRLEEWCRLIDITDNMIETDRIMKYRDKCDFRCLPYEKQPYNNPVLLHKSYQELS